MYLVAREGRSNILMTGKGIMSGSTRHGLKADGALTLGRLDSAQRRRRHGPVAAAGKIAALECPVGERHWGDGIDVRIETCEAIHVASIRDVGALPDVGPCFRRLFRWATSVGAPTGRVLTLSFQRSDTSPRQRWYWKAGVELFTREQPPPGIELEAVGVGRHAVLRLVGSHERIAEVYQRFFEEWLPDSGEVPAQRACLELYRNTPAEVAAERLITDLCVPLRD